MNFFESVKSDVTVKQAAEHYGLEVKRNGMTCCPFHNDCHHSMKLNENYFYCFGCGATGDVIDFLSRLFGLSSYEASKKLAYDFGINPDKPPAAIALPSRNDQCSGHTFRRRYAACGCCATIYIFWRAGNKTMPYPAPNDKLDDHFVEACHMLDYVEYLADLLITAELEQRVKIVDRLNEDSLIFGLEERLERLKKEEVTHEKEKAA